MHMELRGITKSLGTNGVAELYMEKLVLVFFLDFMYTFWKQKPASQIEQRK